jgi:molecular chaperone GrpE (heat shock protein)
VLHSDQISVIALKNDVEHRQAHETNRLSNDNIILRRMINAQNQDHHQEREAWKATLQTLEQEKAQQQAQHQADLVQQQAQFQAEIAQQRDGFRRDWHEQQVQIRKYESELQQAQLASFSDMARSGLAPEEDSSIVRDIELLHKNIWTWAKQYGLTAIQEVRQALDQHPGAIRDYFKAAGADPSLYYAQRPPRIKRVPALFLAALVAHDMYTKLFDDPYFFLDSYTFQTEYEKRNALRTTFALLKRRKSAPLLSLHTYVPFHGPSGTPTD